MHYAGRIFKALIRALKSYNFQENFQILIVHDFTHLLTPMESKSTDYVRRTDRLNVQRNRHFDHFLYFPKSLKIDSS